MKTIAEDYFENPLDLNKYLIEKPAATYFIKVKGDSMTGAGIYDGDLLIVDRSATPRSNQIILAVLNGEFTIKRFIKQNEKIVLKSENPKHAPIEIDPDAEFQIWGVVNYCVHKLK
jgi:DNA polymerase V